MSTSLKVVSMAVSFLTATKRSESFLRNRDILCRLTSRFPEECSAAPKFDWTHQNLPEQDYLRQLLILYCFAPLLEPPAAFRNILFQNPSSGPVPSICSVSRPLSSIIFLAAGEGWPFGYPVS